MNTEKWEAVIAKAQSDAAYKQRLLDAPVAVLREAGVDVPEGVSVRVVQSTDKEVWLVLPHKQGGIRFLSPYVAVSDDPYAGTADSKNCQNPAAGCAI